MPNTSEEQDKSPTANNPFARELKAMGGEANAFYAKYEAFLHAIWRDGYETGYARGSGDEARRHAPGYWEMGR